MHSYTLTTENSSLSKLPSLSISDRLHTFPRTSIGSLDEIMNGLTLSPDNKPLDGFRLCGGYRTILTPYTHNHPHTHTQTYHTCIYTHVSTHDTSHKCTEQTQVRT